MGAWSSPSQATSAWLKAVSTVMRALGAAGAIHTREDHQQDGQDRDCCWCYCAGPVKARAGRERDRQPVAGEDFPGDLALLEAGAVA